MIKCTGVGAFVCSCIVCVHVCVHVCVCVCVCVKFTESACCNLLCSNVPRDYLCINVCLFWF